MSQRIVLNPDALELGDMELFEQATGGDLFETLKPVPEIDPVTKMPVPDPDNPGKPKMTVRMNATALVGLIYIVLKKTQPDVTLADVRKMKISDFDLEVEVPDGNPTSGETPN